MTRSIVRSAALARLALLCPLLLVSACVVLSPGSIPELVESEESRIVPVPGLFRLENGLEVWHLESSRVPVVEVAVVVRGGASLDPAGKAGLAALTLTMLDEGAGERTALELADEIDFLGATLETGAERDESTVRLRCLARNLDDAVAILSDVVLRPRFAPEEWDRVKALWLNDLVQRREQPTIVARVVADRFFYGDDHPYGRPIDGFEPDVASIEHVEVESFYRKLFDPRRAVVVCVGDVSRSELAASLERHLGAWKGADAEPIEAPLAPAVSPATRRVIVVDKPDAPQTVIRIQLPAPSRFTKELAPLELANIVFGSSFTSRLSMNLREKNKFTYGAGSGLANRTGGSYLVAQSSVYSQSTGPALRELCKEFRRMGSDEGLTEYEETKARATYRNRLVETLEAAAGTLDVYIEAAAAAKPPITPRQYFGRVTAQTAEEVVDACRRVFRWEHALIVLVGDRALVEKQLAELEGECGLPEAVVVDRDGN